MKKGSKRSRSRGVIRTTILLCDDRLKELMGGRARVYENELTNEVMLQYLIASAAAKRDEVEGYIANETTSTEQSLLHLPRVVLCDLLCILPASDLVRLSNSIYIEQT